MGVIRADEECHHDSDLAALGNAIARSVLDWLDTLPAFETIGILGASRGGACVAFQVS